MRTPAPAKPHLLTLCYGKLAVPAAPEFAHHPSSQPRGPRLIYLISRELRHQDDAAALALHPTRQSDIPDFLTINWVLFLQNVRQYYAVSSRKCSPYIVEPESFGREGQSCGSTPPAASPLLPKKLTLRSKLHQGAAQCCTFARKDSPSFPNLSCKRSPVGNYYFIHVVNTPSSRLPRILTFPQLLGMRGFTYSNADRVLVSRIRSPRCLPRSLNPLTIPPAGAHWLSRSPSPIPPE